MTPPEVLRERLAAARHDGVGFDRAWPVALAAAVNTVQWEREEWIDALSGTIETWRAAWERSDATRPEQALAVIVRPGGEQLPERACEGCGEEMLPDRPRTARFCSDPCRRRANYLRERAAA
jgi:hypothetical protein